MTDHPYNQTAYQRAVTAAASVCGRTSPNPAVGAVVVRNGIIVAWGATQPPGHAHAERQALAHAGIQAHGADLYVTLEPCTFHGRTPPCTDAIIAAGIARVFFVMRDPDPRMGHGAAHILQQHGIQCIQITPDDERIKLQLAPFFMRIQQQRPWLTWKYAMSLDGKIATHTGMSQWISTRASRTVVHHIRSQVDAIMTGSGTVCSDNPQLTVRLGERTHPAQPLRVVIDSRGRSPLQSHLFTDGAARTLLFCSSDAPVAWQQALSQRGVQVICQPQHGHVTMDAVMHELYLRGINHVLLEAGAGLAGACADAQLIDEIHCFVAPGLIGAAAAPSPLAGHGRQTLSDWRQFRIITQQLVDGDLHLHAVHSRIDTLFATTHEGAQQCLPVS
jgi:diaminohydroxyphosphoribosylaminopyrimidine deaminase/5-amino-6-(5-phosphoribosylamino)uracil reductase